MSVETRTAKKLAFSFPLESHYWSLLPGQLSYSIGTTPACQGSQSFGSWNAAKLYFGEGTCLVSRKKFSSLTDSMDALCCIHSITLNNTHVAIHCLCNTSKLKNMVFQ